VDAGTAKVIAKGNIPPRTIATVIPESSSSTKSDEGSLTPLSTESSESTPFNVVVPPDFELSVDVNALCCVVVDCRVVAGAFVVVGR